MSFRFGRTSNQRLNNCEEDLIRVAEKALEYSPYDFGITETLRSVERQKGLVESGKSWTMKSKHLPNHRHKSEALDFHVIINGKVTWEVGYYRKVMQAFVRAAIELGVQIEFGGLWRTTVDAPHVQIML
jgi:peptidoglycan L-alanyl-D-glutamate endopeptidase CwlK